jgi:propionyl-CoA synthetase
MGAYSETYELSVSDPEKFWLSASELIDWTVPPTRALDDSLAPFNRWFPDGALNTSYNALDRHVERGNGDRTALIWDSAMVPLRAVSSRRASWPTSPSSRRRWP